MEDGVRRLNLTLHLMTLLPRHAAACYLRRSLRTLDKVRQ